MCSCASGNRGMLLGGCTVTRAGCEQMSATPPCAPGPVGDGAGLTVGIGVPASAVLVAEARSPAVDVGRDWAVLVASAHPATASSRSAAPSTGAARRATILLARRAHTDIRQSCPMPTPRVTQAAVALARGGRMLPCRERLHPHPPSIPMLSSNALAPLPTERRLTLSRRQCYTYIRLEKSE